jgi:3-ketosteroid 9alpha-monooxygenase subunit A
MGLKTDGPFAKGRKWYSQFYAKRADVATIQAEVNGIYHVPDVTTPKEANHAIDDGLPFGESA